MPAADPYPYVYANADGAAHELHASGRQYLETDFSGGDGTMPYIKSRYSACDGWSKISGTSSDRAYPEAPRSMRRRPKTRAGP